MKILLLVIFFFVSGIDEPSRTYYEIVDNEAQAAVELEKYSHMAYKIEQVTMCVYEINFASGTVKRISMSGITKF